MKNIFTGLILFFFFSGWAQTQTPPPAKPKLVIGLVVDQMRYDFLYRYSDKYSTGGFKRLLREGHSCENTHINYSPSYTACGHTCVYTGSVPSIHGVTGNNWFDWKEDKVVYCTEDTTEKSIGTASKAGMMSPRRMLTTTVTDELRLATNFKSKVIGIAIKDRGSILPAGHTANAAYFYDPSVGNWITSSYYMNDLPAWVKQFNDGKLPEKYLKDNWATLQPIEKYGESTEDDEPYEGTFETETKPVFLHKVGQVVNPSFKILAATPFGNSFTLKFAEDAIVNEKLGANTVPDFLTVSLSSTDYIGHRFGPNSVEIEDCYLRLDNDLAEFFTFLDAHVGKGNYLLFLTADHGAAHVPDFSKQHKIPAGVFPIDTVMKQLEAKLKQQYGDGEWLMSYENMQLYLNNKLLADKKTDRAEFKNTIRSFLTGFEGVSKVLDLENLSNEIEEADLKQAIGNGYYPKRSGELYVQFEPAWFEGMAKGTTHGTVYPYDTHIPLVWMGWKVKPGEDHSDIHMTDIAPTVAAMLHIQEPNGNVGKVIMGVVGK
jgi:hypothetical protein